MPSCISTHYDDGTVTNRVLQPYLDALSSVSSLNDSAITSIVRAVIHKLLQDPNIFVGYNIMTQHLVSKTCGDSKVLKTLDLFSYGTVADYIVDKEHGTYLTLTEAQLTKLRQLTALSVIVDHHRQGIVSYYDIHAAAFASISDSSSNTNSNNNSTTESYEATTSAAAAAKATTIRETENLLSPLMAAKMIVGKLSQKKMSFILGIGLDKSNQSTASNNENTNASTGNKSIVSGTGMTTDSTFSRSLLVIQSRDVQVQETDCASTNVLPKLLSSIQRMRSQINDAHQRLVTISQSDQSSLTIHSPLTTTSTNTVADRAATSSTTMMTTMPMEVERIRLTTTATSAKRSRFSDGSTKE